MLLDTDANAPGPSKARVRVVCAYGYAEVDRVCSQADVRSSVIAGSIVGVFLLGFLGLMVYMVRRHRDYWRAFLLAFLKHEGVIALKVLWELWDISGDLFMFVAIKDSGNPDLFVAFGVFIVPATVFSAATIGLKLWLLKRRTAQRMDVRHALRSAPMDFRLLCDLFMLRTSHRRHDDLKSANDGARYQAYSYILLALTEDAPFCILNTILLHRTVWNRNDPRVLISSQRLCSETYPTNNFLLLLLVLLTSVGMLVYKAMHLKVLPQLWAEHKRLELEAATLALRQAAIDRRMRRTDLLDASAVVDADVAAERELQPMGASEPITSASCSATRRLAAPEDPGGGHAALDGDSDARAARGDEHSLQQLQQPTASGGTAPASFVKVGGCSEGTSGLPSQEQTAAIAATLSVGMTASSSPSLHDQVSDSATEILGPVDKVETGSIVVFVRLTRDQSAR